MASYIKKRGVELIPKSRQNDFMFTEKKPKIKRWPAVYSNPNWAQIYGYTGRFHILDFQLNSNNNERKTH